jgi:hypothetical protein
MYSAYVVLQGICLGLFLLACYVAWEWRDRGSK